MKGAKTTAAAVAVVLAAASGARAQINFEPALKTSDPVGTCLGDPGRDMDALIASCTQMIESSKGATVLANAYLSRGNGWAVKGDYDKAIEDYGQSIQHQPKSFTAVIALSNRAGARSAKDQYDLALQDFDKALRLHPGGAFLYLRRGEMWAKRGDYRRALQDYDQAVGWEPESALSLNASCWARAVLNVELDRALFGCNKAMKYSVKFAPLYDSRAFVHLRRNEFEQAIADADVALKARPKQAPSQFVRGIAKIRLGQRSEGDADVASAEALEPGITKRYAGWGITP